MSYRSLVEINHDFWMRHGDELLPALQRYLASASRENAEELERFGFKVVGMRHHSETFLVDADADGFPPSYVGKPRP